MKKGDKVILITIAIIFLFWLFSNPIGWIVFLIGLIWFLASKSVPKKVKILTGSILGTIAIIFIALIVYFINNPSPDNEHSTPYESISSSSPSSDRMAATDRIISAGEEDGLIQKVEVDLANIYVNEYLWNAMNFDDKSKAAEMFLEYIRLRSNNKFVSIKSWSSGNEIGSCNIIDGFKSKE